MKRLSILTLGALVAFQGAPALAQSSNPVPTTCKGLSPIDEAACYKAQDAATNKSANHAATKQNRKEALAHAVASTDPPQVIAADLLNDGYGQAADKRYRTQLVSSPGHPIKENGQYVYAMPAFDSDDRRTALYLQLLRIIGKTELPPSSAKLARGQAKAAQKLAAAIAARASGQPYPGVNAAPGTAGSTVAAGSSPSPWGLLVLDQSIITPTRDNNNGVWAAQSVDGTAMMTLLPLTAMVSTSFNAPTIDYNDKGTCTTFGSGMSHSEMARQAIMQCFGRAVHNLRVQAAQDAIAEYHKWVHDPYGFTPPAGFAYSAPARPVSDGHGHTLSVAGLYSAEPSAAPDVRMFGQADAINAFIGGDQGRAAGSRMLAKLQTSNETDMPILRAAIGDPPTPDPTVNLNPGTALWNKFTSLIGQQSADSSVAAGGGFAAGAGIMSTETAYDAIFPYASRGFFVAGEGIVGGVEAAEAEAGPPGLVAGFLTVLAQSGYEEAKKVFGNRDLPGDLDNELAAAKAAPDPTAAALAASQAGRTELFTVFVGGVQHIQW